MDVEDQPTPFLGTRPNSKLTSLTNGIEEFISKTHVEKEEDKALLTIGFLAGAGAAVNIMTQSMLGRVVPMAVNLAHIELTTELGMFIAELEKIGEEQKSTVQ